MDNKEISLEEMWKVIEGYGINRKIMEMSRHSLPELKALYSLIKKRNVIITQKADNSVNRKLILMYNEPMN